MGPSIHYGVKTENQRVNAVVEKNRLLDNEVVDTKMIHFPNWRNPNSEKYSGHQDFRNYSKTYNFDNNQAWHQIPIVEDQDDVDPYIEGLEKLGNDLSQRARDKTKEVKIIPPFITLSILQITFLTFLDKS